ncbi:hypothetical protein LEP1GSC060_0284 [Leptospira weilii serovar Ranarum str. ICFT]|uniref:Uncharacterized protein n=1 Tax=Leptospira weilii serovar Ranarum str. ICFT TaxID=1218598 RepID=N1WH24_9LEPT|nr:hypothetical protein LEP1GSC060_0284 [Leptospira weilii serovar Ranarum str. ICFT]
MTKENRFRSIHQFVDQSRKRVPAQKPERRRSLWIAAPGPDSPKISTVELTLFRVFFRVRFRNCFQFCGTCGKMIFFLSLFS